MNYNIEENSNNRDFNWSILLIISLGSIVMGTYRDGFGALFPFLQEEFELSRTQIGLYTSFLYFASSFVSIVSGQLVDLNGSKKSMIYGILIVAIALFLHSIVPNFMSAMVLATLAGIGMSINAPAANKSITECFHQKLWSTATGIWSTAFPIGGLLAASFLPFLGILFGWRKAILFPGMLALFCVIMILIFYHDNRIKENQFKRSEINLNYFLKGINLLINNKELLAIAIYGFF
ncbi:MAG: MFS transporter [Eubacteriales bacterium]